MKKYVIDEKYNDLLDLVEKKMSYAAHDLDHVMRVYNLSMFLAEEEKSIDPDVLIPSVLLHDIARRMEDEDVTGEIDHAMVGAEMAEKILRGLNYEPLLISRISDCIRSHRFRSGFIPETIEAMILFDADKLDVIGAVGIARSFMLAGQHGERIFRDISMDRYLEENVGSNGRVRDQSKHASNLEFELKLKKIPERLYTEKAKNVARERISYMQCFFRTLNEEINGIK